MDFYVFHDAGSYPLDMLKCYRAKQTGARDLEGDVKRTGISKLVHNAENYLHHKNQYEDDTTDNLGDAQNPLHRVA